jgi:signal transduction histidine kinase
MNPLSFLKKSLAAKLVLAFILTAVPPMLIASHVATSMISDMVNTSVGRWVHDASRYLFNTIRETGEEISALHTLLAPRFTQDSITFSPTELEAIPFMDVDMISVKDAEGRELFTNAVVQSVDEAPLYPGSLFHWATMEDGSRELAITVRRDLIAENGDNRLIELASLFNIRFAENKDREPLGLRIFLPDGDGFKLEYASLESEGRDLPPGVAQAIKAGAKEYLILDADWTGYISNTFALFTPVRNEQGDVLAVFAVSVVMFPLPGWVMGYDALFWAFFILGTLLSGCIGHFLAQSLTGPIRRLNRGVRDIASGNFGSRVEVQGNDEVAELSAGFNLMGGQLELMQRESVQSARRERSRMLGEIALGFAHEIRNPLLVIKTSTELMHGKLPEDGRESRLFGFVIEEIGRIDSLISEFLSFAKPAPLKLEYFQLDRLVRDVLELSAAELASRGLACSFVDETADRQDACVLGEENKIRQVLLNLVLNAMDAMSEGGELAIRLYAMKKNGQVCLEVKDTGTGIPEALLPTIHLPFISTKKDGLGLGLAKVHAIVEEHGGSIVCASTPGQGAIFTVCLNT